jgi:hypothetical protein
VVAVGGTGVGEDGMEVAVGGAGVAEAPDRVALVRICEVGELSGVAGTWDVLVESTFGFTVKTEVNVRSGVK